MIGSRVELEERATAGLEQLQELHRPWIDDVTVSCEACGEVAAHPGGRRCLARRRDRPFDTRLGESAPGRARLRDRASEGLSNADLPDHSYWEQWFADWVSESREQIRLWFYSMSFMAVTLVGRSPYERVLAYERVRDETGGGRCTSPPET